MNQFLEPTDSRLEEPGGWSGTVSSFYRWRDWGPEALNASSKPHIILSHRTKIWTSFLSSQGRRLLSAWEFCQSHPWKAFILENVPWFSVVNSSSENMDLGPVHHVSPPKKPRMDPNSKAGGKHHRLSLSAHSAGHASHHYDPEEHWLCILPSDPLFLDCWGHAGVSRPPKALQLVSAEEGIRADRLPVYSYNPGPATVCGLCCPNSL